MTRSHLSLLLLLGLLGSVASADEPGSEKEAQFERWVDYYCEVAGGYDVRLESVPDRPLEVSEEPIHVYTNPSSGRDSHGAFFVWTHHGRAEAIGAIWSRLTGEASSARYVIHEFQSLSTEPLVAKGADGVVWTPRVPGIELKEVEGAPLPASSRTLRLAQMRAIARQFAGFHTHPTEFQLRLLAQPLYRYEEVDGDHTTVSGDGAVFGFFMDWDPEILLVIEVRPTDEDPRWHFAAGRFSDKPLRLEYNGADVWEHGGGDFGDLRGPFFAKHGVAVRPAVLEGE